MSREALIDDPSAKIGHSCAITHAYNLTHITHTPVLFFRNATVILLLKTPETHLCALGGCIVNQRFMPKEGCDGAGVDDGRSLFHVGQGSLWSRAVDPWIYILTC